MPTIIGTETQTVAYSTSYTIPADCTFVVALVSRAGGAAAAAITLGGSAMTQQVTQGNGDAAGTYITTLASPLTGSRTLAVSASVHTYRITLVYLKDVDLGSPIIATASAGGTWGTSVSVACTSETGALVLDALVHQSLTTVTAGAGQTEIDEAQGGTSTFGSSYETASGSSTTMSWTFGAAQRPAISVIAIRSGAGASNFLRPYMSF